MNIYKIQLLSGKDEVRGVKGVYCRILGVNGEKVRGIGLHGNSGLVPCVNVPGFQKLPVESHRYDQRYGNLRCSITTSFGSIEDFERLTGYTQEHRCHVCQSKMASGTPTTYRPGMSDERPVKTWNCMNQSCQNVQAEV